MTKYTLEYDTLDPSINTKTLNAILRYITLMKGFRYILILWFCVLFGVAYGQTDISKLVNLKEFVVSASLEDFDVADFIKQVEEDTTFYQAFLNMRYFPHDITSAMSVYEKDESERGTLERKARQFRSTDDMMWVVMTFDKTNGKMKKRNGEWRYLTAQMYDELFFPTVKEKVRTYEPTKNQELVKGSSIEKHKAQLKRMMFNPGAEIENVPLIGDKMAIFSNKMMQYYKYSIYAANWKDSIPCVVFSCYVKEGDEDEVVIRDLTTYFDKDTHEVLSRDYHLVNHSILFDFDITMKVENTRLGGWLVPEFIKYSGFWDIPFKKPEIISFQLKCRNYLME